MISTKVTAVLRRRWPILAIAFAVIAEKRGLKSTAYPSKSFYYLGGLTEGAETILRAGQAGMELVAAQWGLIAPGSKTRRPTSRAILTNNARVETVASRPTYRSAWSAGRRCLIL